MAERFTKEQKNLADCMKLLINLYYFEKDNYKLKVWWKPESVEILKRLFDRVFGNYKYYDEIRKFEVKIHNQIFLYSIDEQQRDDFVMNLSNLDAEISDNITYHFDLLGIENKSINKFYDMHLQDKKINTELVYFKPVLMTTQTQKDLCFLKDKAIYILRNKHEYINNKLKVISADFNKVFVDSRTDFGRELLKVSPREKPFYEIPGLLSPQNNFIRLIRSILVNYHVAFGDYSRIKECQNEDCEHIYFEKKKGESKYCSTACRVTSHKREEPDKLKCRGRQNKWIDRRLKSLPEQPSVIYKDDCIECKAVMWRGECPVLMEKNALFIELLQSTSKKTNK